MVASRLRLEYQLDAVQPRVHQETPGLAASRKLFAAVDGQGANMVDLGDLLDHPVDVRAMWLTPEFPALASETSGQRVQERSQRILHLDGHGSGHLQRRQADLHLDVHAQ